MSWTRTLLLAVCVAGALGLMSDVSSAQWYFIEVSQQGQDTGFAVVDPSADEPIQVQVFHPNGQPWEGIPASSIELFKDEGDFACGNDPLFFGNKWIATADTDAAGITTFEPHGSGCGVWTVVVGDAYEHLTMRTPDFSGDGQVDLGDFVTFQSYFLTSEPCADFDSDGDVDLADHVLFTGYYLNSCN